MVALRALKDVLRGLVLAESVLAHSNSAKTAITYEQFMRELRAAIEGATVETNGDIGQAIRAASILQVRGLSFRAVALIGLAEREFPQPEIEDALLRERDRAALRDVGFAIESQLRGDEGSFCYAAITRARERLLVTRPYLADDGQAWEPSPYWRHRHELVDAPVRHLKPNDPLPSVKPRSRAHAMALAWNN